jgi:hypothetical protein
LVWRFSDSQPTQDSYSLANPILPGLRVRILLSGDRETEVRYLAGQVGITEALFGKSPEEKIAIEGKRRSGHRRCS